MKKIQSHGDIIISSHELSSTIDVTQRPEKPILLEKQDCMGRNCASILFGFSWMDTAKLNKPCLMAELKVTHVQGA